VAQELLRLLDPASLADDVVRQAVEAAAYYAVKYRRQAVLPPLLQLLGPDYTDAAWFQVRCRILIILNSLRCMFGRSPSEWHA
jgi:hypothetical protein